MYFFPYLEKILQYAYVKHQINLLLLVLTFLLKLFAHSNNCDLLLKRYPCYDASSMKTQRGCSGNFSKRTTEKQQTRILLINGKKD